MAASRYPGEGAGRIWLRDVEWFEFGLSVVGVYVKDRNGELRKFRVFDPQSEGLQEQARIHVLRGHAFIILEKGQPNRRKRTNRIDFGNWAQFWLHLQSRYDLPTTEAHLGQRIKAEVIAPID